MATSEWSSVASAWDTRSGEIEDLNTPVTDALLGAAAIVPGERVLELGAGTGQLAADLAQLTGPGGSVVASDVAPAFVDILRRRFAGVPNVLAETVDASSIPGADDSYDAVLARMSLMFVQEPLVALCEVNRVLRPGGRLAAAVWGAPERNPWMLSVGFATMMSGLLSGPPPTAPGGPFSLSDPDELSKLAREAGFEDVQVEVVDYRRRYASADEHFDMVRVLAPPIAAALGSAAPAQLEAVRKGAADFIAEFRGEDGSYDLPVSALVMVAR